MTDALSKNYFELFEIPVSYDVDLAQVQQRYRKIQKAVHPDKYANAGSQERRVSMQQTSLINQALHTLKHPVERAVYLLQLKGVDFAMDKGTTMDAAFLMEQMEMREKLEAVCEHDDPLAELDTMSAGVKSNMNAMADDFKRAYASAELDDAIEAVRKLQFLYKAKQEIDELAANIEDKMI
jgi:molecular chaperone HscB